MSRATTAALANASARTGDIRGTGNTAARTRKMSRPVGKVARKAGTRLTDSTRHAAEDGLAYLCRGAGASHLIRAARSLVPALSHACFERRRSAAHPPNGLADADREQSARSCSTPCQYRCHRPPQRRRRLRKPLCRRRDLWLEHSCLVSSSFPGRRRSVAPYPLHQWQHVMGAPSRSIPPETSWWPARSIPTSTWPS